MAQLDETSCGCCLMVATNLEKPGILRELSESGKLREFCGTSGKNYNKSTIEYLRKTTVDWVNRIIMI